MIGAATGFRISVCNSSARQSVCSSIACSIISRVRRYCSVSFFLVSCIARISSFFLYFAGMDFSALPSLMTSISDLPFSSTFSFTVISSTMMPSKNRLLSSSSFVSMRSVRRVTSAKPAFIARFCSAISAALRSLALRCAPNFFASFLYCTICRYRALSSSSSLNGISAYAITRSLLRLSVICPAVFSASSLPCTASAYFRARECFVPSEMYFAAS